MHASRLVVGWVTARCFFVEIRYAARVACVYSYSRLLWAKYAIVKAFFSPSSEVHTVKT